MSLFQFASFMLVMLSIWRHVTYFWGDHRNMTLMLPIKTRRTSTCSLRRARGSPWSLFHRIQSRQKKRSQNSYSYATEV